MAIVCRRNLSCVGFPLLQSNRQVDSHLASLRKFLCKPRSYSKSNKTSSMGCSSSKVEITKETKKPSPTVEDGEYVEDVVCKTTDVNDNEMKAFDLKDAGKVLLIRQNGKINAIGPKCTHYGAPLVSGALGDGRVRCQWHGACFNIATGDIEDFPGLDSLPCFQVTIEGDNVKVCAKKSELESSKRVKTSTARDKSNGKSIIVIGGGPAGAKCVETLRQEGFSGKITLLAKERYLPYDRVKVNKTMDLEISKSELRPQAFYTQNDIEVLNSTSATALNATEQRVTLSNGKTLSYDQVFIATGSNARKSNVPGNELKNVITLREYDDGAYTLSQLSPNKHVVVLGVSFISMEAASYCVNKVEKVTVIGRGSVPFASSFGPEIGAAVMKMFEEKGVHFIMNSGITKCIDNGSGTIESVMLTDGSSLKADICIMGTGSSLNTDFLANSGLTINTDGSIEVDDYLTTNIPNIYAGGDIANAPVWSHNKKATIGHWGLAHLHGHIAGLNICGKKTKLEAVPYFWSMMFGKSIRYAGHGSYDEIVYNGNVDELKFVAFYLKGDEVVAVSSCGMDPVVSQFAEVMAQGRKLYRRDLEGDSLAWASK